MNASALPAMRSAEYQNWTITFHANGIQFEGADDTKLATALGRTSVTVPTP